MESDKLIISKYNDVYIHVDCERSIAQELRDAFRFEVPGAKFNPKVRSGYWDGYIALFNTRTHLIYFGLLEKVLRFAESRGYTTETHECGGRQDFTKEQGVEFFASLNAPHTADKHQINSFVAAVRESRTLTVSPTGSGKSFIIYGLLQYYKQKSMIIVPTTNLKLQMHKDLIEYGFPASEIHLIETKTGKETKKGLTITTWQAIKTMPKSFFDEFDVVIGDECHLFTAKSLTGIMERMTNTPYRFGFTGTLDGSKTHALVLEGLFGNAKQFTNTVELIKEGRLADFQIRCIVLDHPKKDRKKRDYPDEMDFLCSNPKRNDFISKLTLSLEGNTLLLFQYVEKHGKVLYDKLKQEAESIEGKTIHFIHGGIKGDERERIRELVETPQIKIHFGDFFIRAGEQDEIPLSNGTTKLAKDLTEEDDLINSYIDAKRKG